MACNRVFQRHFNNYPNYSGILYLNWRIPKFYLYSEEFIFGEGKKIFQSLRNNRHRRMECYYNKYPCKILSRDTIE